MSRLDSFIRRMQAQRACLDLAATLIADLPGPIFELGLGNGRTYDHLREILPDRDIYVFERVVKAHPACIPPADRLILGDALETMAATARRVGRPALIHSDLGAGDDAANRALATRLADPVRASLAAQGILLANIELPLPGWTRLPEPPGVKPGRYFLWRR